MRSRSIAVCVGVLLGAASGAGAVDTTPPEGSLPDCGNPPPRVLAVGLPYSEGLDLDRVQEVLGEVVGRLYLEQGSGETAGRRTDPCPKRPLQINLALGSDYQILDWLARALVDMAAVPVLALHLLRRDGVDLVEVEDPAADPAAFALEPLVGRTPALALAWVEDGVPDSRPGHQGDLAGFAGDLWREVVLGEPPAAPAGSPPVERLILPSHLSTAGFLVPVLEIEAALDRMQGAGEAFAEERRRFWEAFYGRVCFRFADHLDRGAGEACAPPAGGAVLEVAAEADAGADDGAAGRALEGPPVLGLRAAYRDRLVVRRAIAEELFGTRAYAAVEDSPHDELRRLEALFERTARDPLGRTVPVPTAFEGFLSADAFFGTRTFAFTVGESLDLIDHHQWISGRSGLALVLPGGGVKAAYQSRILDELYGRGHLQNAGVTAEGPPGSAPLSVESVVGTSGGALLGFFVARLGASGPWNLSDVLWKPNGSGAGGGSYLAFSEIFGWTDLPRYVSLLLIFLVFAGTLGVFSLRRRGFLAPGRAPGEAEEMRPSLRPRLFLLLAAALGLTPLLVRWVTGAVSEEHVPEFEALLYAVLVVLAMFADQCLVWTGREQEPPPPHRIDRSHRIWVPPAALVAVGLALVVLPVALKPLPGAGSWLEGEIGTGAAYLWLGLLAAGLALSAVRRKEQGRREARGVALWLLAFAAASAVALLLLRLSSRAFLERLDRTPLLFLALFAALLVTAVLRYVAAGGPEAGSGRISRRFTALESGVIRLTASGKLRKLAAVLVPFFACLIVLDLTRPEAKAFLAVPLVELAAAPSKLHAPRGALAVCLGAVLVSVGALLTLHHRRNHYRLEGVGRFRDAVGLVVVGLAFAVYVALFVGVALVGWLDRRGWLGEPFAGAAQLTLFELTPGFWIGLLLVSALASFAVVRWARAGRRGGGRVAVFLDESLRYLCSVHPNGHLVPRRFVRLAAFAVFGLVWWNFLLAPALYGNRYAVDYLEGADRRFEIAFCLDRGHEPAFCEDEERTPMSYALTARYLVPANALTTDGTRFVLAVPGGEACPAVPASPGVTWRRFHALHAEHLHAGGEDDGCEDLDLSQQEPRGILKDYVFASGSPFPAFPPRRVVVDRELQTREALVDGGYSNNVPLEAAAKLGAEQALVIHSSHPAPRPGRQGWMSALAGPLVNNLPRILGFLYQRSQQLDRRSGSALFVISLAPPYRPDWPLLTDFRSATVSRMIREAELGLEQRIGLVESWGPPRFQKGLEISDPAGRTEAGEPGRLRRGLTRATPAGASPRAFAHRLETAPDRDPVRPRR